MSLCLSPDLPENRGRAASAAQLDLCVGGERKCPGPSKRMRLGSVVPAGRRCGPARISRPRPGAGAGLRAPSCPRLHGCVGSGDASPPSARSGERSPRSRGTRTRRPPSAIWTTRPLCHHVERPRGGVGRVGTGDTRFETAGTEDGGPASLVAEGLGKRGRLFFFF